jgi:hypothetical protein
LMCTCLFEIEFLNSFKRTKIMIDLLFTPQKKRLHRHEVRPLRERNGKKPYDFS